jgi:dihydroflavonol-4-reductase
MKIAAVTGGTGFVGSHLVRLLCERDMRVRVLVRPSSRLDALDGLPVEKVAGDLRKPDSLKPLLEGVSVLYHVAADYRLWSPEPVELYESNVEGTGNILAAAMAASVPKVVYTSTVGCLGIPKNGTPGDESSPVRIEDMIGDYKRSKFLAEQVALEFAGKGLPIVIVNPSTPVGPGDHKPTPTGKIIVDFLNGRIPAFVETGLNLIDVRDAALGHILAAEKGRVGEKYILGNRNLTFAQILEMIAATCDRTAPRTKIPYGVAYLAGALSTAWSRLVTHRPPAVSLESVRMSRKMMFFSAEKAVRELGLPQSPVETAVSDAVEWFVEHGYVQSGQPK